MTYIQPGILSIQSHVAYGYVGNKAATYPLQAMGYDVWPVNTVQFSNHTGYGQWGGDIFEAEHVRSVIRGLEQLDLVPHCQAILSGYMGSQAICEAVYETVQRFKQKNNTIVYLCDPVIGNTHCFVKPEVLDFFKTRLSADIITPNQFEAETLSNIPIHDEQDAMQAAAYFHHRHIPIVMITGIRNPDNAFFCFLSDAFGNIHLKIPTHSYDFKIPPNGTGDLFSALFLGHYLKTRDTVLSLHNTHMQMDQIMRNTLNSQSRELQVTSIRYDDPP
jgi:pyridoxine kinase